MHNTITHTFFYVVGKAIDLNDQKKQFGMLEILLRFQPLMTKKCWAKSVKYSHIILHNILLYFCGPFLTKTIKPEIQVFLLSLLSTIKCSIYKQKASKLPA